MPGSNPALAVAAGTSHIQLCMTSGNVLAQEPYLANATPPPPFSSREGSDVTFWFVNRIVFTYISLCH